jgi:quercetin 2,3-dioxygenase
LRLIISPDGAEGSLSVYQNVRVYVGCFDADEQAQFSLAEDRYGYVHIVRGSLTVNGTVMNVGDGVRIRNERQIDLQQGHNAEVLVFDLRPQEQPGH